MLYPDSSTNIDLIIKQSSTTGNPRQRYMMAVAASDNDNDDIVGLSFDGGSYPYVIDTIIRSTELYIQDFNKFVVLSIVDSTIQFFCIHEADRSTAS